MRGEFSAKRMMDILASLLLRAGGCSSRESKFDAVTYIYVRESKIALPRARYRPN